MQRSRRERSLAEINGTCAFVDYLESHGLGQNGSSCRCPDSFLHCEPPAVKAAHCLDISSDVRQSVAHTNTALPHAFGNTEVHRGQLKESIPDQNRPAQ